MARNYTLRGGSSRGTSVAGSNQGNVRRFDADLQVFVKALKEDLARIVVEISIDLHAKIARKTPVDTGRARVSWDVTEGDPSGFVPPSVPFGVPSAPGRFQTAPPLSASGKYMGALPINKGTLTGKDTIFVTSALDYVADLDAGKSRQARGGMVDISIAEIQIEIASIVAKFRSS